MIEARNFHEFFGIACLPEPALCACRPFRACVIAHSTRLAIPRPQENREMIGLVNFNRGSDEAPLAEFGFSRLSASDGIILPFVPSRTPWTARQLP